jgi:uncharacterized protein YecE (DUF72 family)
LIRIGISGWRYEPWRGVWYPEGLPQRRELEFCGLHFPTVEVNGSFYSLQRPEYYEEWYRDTPPGFVFSLKGSRYITHLLRLKNIEKPLANFFASGIFNLRDKLGPFLWQFPPMFRFDPGRLEAFFALLPRDTEEALALARRRDARMTGRSRLAIHAKHPLRHAVEIRHPSFMNNAFTALLRKHDIGLVVADTAGKWPKMFHVTSDFGLRAPARRYQDLYQRLFGPRAGKLGEAHPRLVEGRSRRVRVLRQRRQGKGALRRAQSHAQAAPRMVSRRKTALAVARGRRARAAAQVRLRPAGHRRESRVGRPETILNS